MTDKLMWLNQNKIKNANPKKRKSNNQYTCLLNNIGKTLEQARAQVYYSINTILVKTYWEIGKQIIEFEQKNKKLSRYGSKLFEKIAFDLKEKYGKGFSRSNIIYMKLLYLKHPKSQTLSDQLNWSHYSELLTINDDLERNFYEKQCIHEKWSVRELKRQVNSALFYRIALSKNKKQVITLSKKGLITKKPSDLIKEPYILEFLGLPENNTCNEKQLEQKIIDNLQAFLLELGKGFSFIARQFRISLDNNHYYVDLVFYHRILKCFVLIDLKTGKVNHQDIGQMNLYLNYFKAEENAKKDNAPIGIILGTQKNELEIKYALGSISNKLFASKYKLYLPDKKQLQIKLLETLI